MSESFRLFGHRYVSSAGVLKSTDGENRIIIMIVSRLAASKLYGGFGR